MGSLAPALQHCRQKGRRCLFPACKGGDLEGPLDATSPKAPIRVSRG